MEKLLSLRALLAFVTLISLVQSEMTTQTQCKGYNMPLPLSHEQVEIMKACAKESGIKTAKEMTEEKLPCFYKCYIEKSNMTDDQGKPYKENIMKEVKASFPDETKKEMYLIETEKCIANHGHNVDPNDDNCLSYTSLALCITKAFKNVCEQ